MKPSTGLVLNTRLVEGLLLFDEKVNQQPRSDQETDRLP